MAVHDRHGPEARRALEREAALPLDGWRREVARGLELGLPGADSIVDRTIPTGLIESAPDLGGLLDPTFVEARAAQAGAAAAEASGG